MHKGKETQPDSLERQVGRPSYFSRTKYALALAGALTAAEGCAVGGYRLPESGPRVQQVQEVLEAKYGEPLAQMVRDEFSALLVDRQALETFSNPFVASDALYKEVQKISTRKGFGEPFTDAYKNLKDQNSALARLAEGARVQREALQKLQGNVGNCDDLVIPLTTADAEVLRAAYTDLRSTLQNLTKKDRDMLDAALGSNPEYQKAKAYNTAGLNTIRQMSEMAGALLMHEGRYEGILHADDLIALATKSLDGVDLDELAKKVMFIGSTDENGQIRLPLHTRTVGDICRGDESHPLRRQFSPGTTVGDAYATAMKWITDEAASWDDESRHKITNDYAFLALSLAQQAREQGLLSTQEFIAVNKYITKEIAGRIGNKNGVDFNWFTDFALPIIVPVWEIYNLIDNLPIAFSKDTYQADPSRAAKQFFNDKKLETLARLALAIYEGETERLGYAQGDNYKGDTGLAQKKSIVAGTVLGLKALALAGVVDANRGGISRALDKLSGNEDRTRAPAPTPPAPSASGGENGGNGTGN